MKNNNKLLYLASAIAVIILFQVIYGLKILIPTNVSWLMTAMHDWGTHYLGWFFYRNEPWHFPLGHINGYYYPVGTNVGFTDSIPLLAIFFKLFAPILPADFQYFGLWLLSCHLLIAWFTIRLLSLFKVAPLHIFIAVVLVAANPVLIYRGMHPALCAHWILIASAYLYFLDSSGIRATRILRYQLLLLVIAALVNPYLFFMVLGFTAAIPLKLYFFDKTIGKKRLITYFLISAFSILLVWWIVGLISFGKKENLAVNGGYGLLSMNLNALFDSWGASSYFPALKRMSDYQYEGFMYLGLGIFFLAFILLGYLVVALIRKDKNARPLPRRPWTLNSTNIIPLLVLLVLLGLFAITHIVTFGDKIIFKVPVPDTFVRLGNVFRASGRFFWTPYYAILFLILILIAKSRMPQGLKTAILVVALFLQYFDTRILLHRRHLSFGPYDPPVSKNWRTIISRFDKIFFYPPFQTDYLTHLDYQYFCYLAVQEKKLINIGYVARADNDAIRSASDSLESRLGKGNLDPKTLYITTAPYLQQFFMPLQRTDIRLNTLDGYYYLFDKNTADSALLSLTTALNAPDKERTDSLVSALLSKRTEFVEAARAGTTKGSIKYNAETVADADAYLHVSGWAFDSGKLNNKGDSIFVFLSAPDKFYIARTNIHPRPDITGSFKAVNLDDAGFEAVIFKDKVVKDTYKLGIAIKDPAGNWTYELTGREIGAGPSPGKVPVKLDKAPPTADIRANMEKATVKENTISLSGWAFLQGQQTDHCSISILFRNAGDLYIYPADPVLRLDVSGAFGVKGDYDHAGFSAVLPAASLPTGKYTLGVLISGPGEGKKGCVWTDKEININ